MLQQIAELVEFDLNRFSPEAILNDFIHKYRHSWVEIDGKPQYLMTIQKNPINEGIQLECSDVKSIVSVITKLKTIKRILPETGLYKSEYGLVYLSRIPARQWIKSFSPDQNYRLQILARNPKTDRPSVRNTILNPDVQFHKETMIYQNDLWLHWKCIGTAKEDKETIQLASTKYLKEIEELWPQYQIILGQNLRRGPQVEKLIMDF